MDNDYTIFWGDTHHNTYQQHIQDPPLAKVLESASAYLDFYTGAYYTPVYTRIGLRPGLPGLAQAPHGGHLSEARAGESLVWQGVHLEATKDSDSLAREWAEFQAATAAFNDPGSFVTFPGYEWQGNGQWGDHNVVYKLEGPPIFAVDTIAELYAYLRGLDAIAIPHHTAYLVGQRAPVWAACDDRVSPFAEVFSIHGCSETDEEIIGLRQNTHMGPGVGGGTYQDALDRGLHLGAICSTDNWTNVPGHWGQGLMACLATDLTRDSLWDAFLKRRVYGVTGDRIQLEFTCNGEPMGSILPYTDVREIAVAVRGSDAIDRIEVLRDGRVIFTYCHQGNWDLPPAGRSSRYKLRVEAGWGPRLGDVPAPERKWEGEFRVGGGRIVGWEPCWIASGQTAPDIRGDKARFRMVSRQEDVGGPQQGAILFEFEAWPDAQIVLRLNGLEAQGSVKEFALRSQVLWYRDECVRLLRETTGLEQGQAPRGDIYYQMAYKAKLHRVVPEAGYTASFTMVDDGPLCRESNYRVRVEQRNGQRAWSSPIWVQPAA